MGRLRPRRVAMNGELRNARDSRTVCLENGCSTPSTFDVETALGDFFRMKVVTVRFERETFIATIPGPPDGRRWIEVKLYSSGQIYVTTRRADALTEALRDGLAQFLAIRFTGTLEES